jgi:dienelactone hydrolase
LQKAAMKSHLHFSPGTGVRRLGTATMALAILAGCSSPSVPKPDEAKVRQFAGRGYLADEHYGIATSFASWSVGERSFDIALTVPAKSGVLPVVIYLPALGETRSAGETWRSAWAQAGYAVLSVQPLADDAKAWTSFRARAGDFTLLARERYAANVMSARIDALREVLGELSRRQSAKEVPLDRFDLSQIAVAGYDLGAYTAMVVAGEKIKDRALPGMPLPIKAVIALSPYADFSGAPFAMRYDEIHGPVLCITSDNDTDALGLVTSPAVRTAPFKYMPDGDKFLMVMPGIPHAVIGGGHPEKGEAEPVKSSPGERPSGDKHKGSHGKSGGDSGNAMPSFPGNITVSPTALAIGQAAIQTVTTAFLDAFVRNDQIAREWLTTKDVSRWLGDQGEIKRK